MQLIVSIMELFLLYENGRRFSDANFSWGYMHGIFFVFVTSLILLAEDTMCAIPWEVLVEPRLRLYVGVYGVGDGGETVLPTVWADLGEIYPGAVPDQNAQPPTPDLWQQILTKTSDHRFLFHRDAEEQHPINAISGLAKQLSRIPAPAEAITNAELEELLK